MIIPHARYVRVENKGKGRTLAAQARLADRFLSRMIGLLGRGSLPEGDGLVIAPGSSIHTFFMRFPIDVVFVSREGVVLKTAENVKPWRLAFSPRGTRYTIELPVGAIGASQTERSDRLEFSAA
ncbi:MAG: DUF192 domain-containing protein [Dehalococcoidia bacterium]|nr:DUF192 domain-containing protein [Dehalococcoidia bacterium]